MSPRQTLDNYITSHYDKLCGTLKRYVFDTDMSAQDLVNQSYEVLVDKLDRIEKANEKGYLNTLFIFTARNIASRYKSKQSRKQNVGDNLYLLDTEPHVDEEPIPDQALIDAKIQAEFDKALQRISEGSTSELSIALVTFSRHTESRKKLIAETGLTSNQIRSLNSVAIRYLKYKYKNGFKLSKYYQSE